MLPEVVCLLLFASPFNSKEQNLDLVSYIQSQPELLDNSLSSDEVVWLRLNHQSPSSTFDNSLFENVMSCSIFHNPEFLLDDVFQNNKTAVVNSLDLVIG